MDFSEQSDISTKEKIVIRDMKTWNVVIHNDDFTSFELVMFILMEVFEKSIEESEEIAFKVHTEGKKIVGSYSHEIAEQKQSEGVGIARKYNSPLKITIEIN